MRQCTFFVTVIFFTFAAGAEIALKGGRFWLGTDAPDAKDGEGPARLVHVGPFQIDSKPVTNEQFRAFVRETK